GGTGANTFDGGNGQDTVSYANATQAIAVDMSNSSGNTGDAAGDTYVSIENLVGTNYNDALRATGYNDAIYGGRGNDFVLARSGDDALFGEAGNDRLEGGNGADTLDGGTGADSLNGGAGQDIASYASAQAAVSIDLSNSSRNTGDGVGDTFISIEGLAGSDYNDALRATGYDDAVFGGGGNDFI
ncbi:unnamed protein product, partial [Ectocarpus sp. 12 AP-2014]